MSSALITEHPAWSTSAEGPVRVIEHDDVAWVARWNGNGLVIRPVDSSSAAPPPIAYTSPINLPRADAVQPLVNELAKLGTVQRLTNPSLWDALATAILRNITRGGQPQQVHHEFRAAHGRHVKVEGTTYALMPSPDVVLSLSDAALRETGVAVSRATLRHAARVYREQGEHWKTLDAERLAKEVRSTVHGVGDYTAALAAADFTGDFSIYPHSDLAVRTWVRRAAPGIELPASDREFEAQWRRWAPDRTQLHTLTLFTLTWGAHARSHVRTDR